MKTTWNSDKYINKNFGIILSTESFFTSRTSKGVLSLESAASWWGFEETIEGVWNITVPRNYNPTKNKEYYKYDRMVEEKYNIDIIKYTVNNREIRVYSPERTIVEIIKKAKKKMSDVLFQIIKNFFQTFKYNSERLHELSLIFKVDNETKIWEMALSE